jgi:hypothetical protein
MNFYQLLRSILNSFLWRLRRTIGFRRSGYREFLTEPAHFSEEAARINSKYKMDPVRKNLSAFTGARNLSTLWYLEKLLEDHQWPAEISLVEPGCQEFARLPAWRAFFSQNGNLKKVIGVEIDPFPILQDLHSRWDRAQYYISLAGDGARYEAADFFNWEGKANVIFCFYPFVSVIPALAWGLPAQFASAEKWINSFERVLDPGGTLLVVHQGPWEEEDFDNARKNMASQLFLKKRMTLDCPFFKTAHPMCASVYIKKVPAGGNCEDF